MARLVDAEGDPAGAVAFLDRAEELYRPGFFPDVRPIAAMRARVRIAQGELEDAAEWARARDVAATDEVDYLSEFDHLTLVRLLIAQHRAHPGTGVLDRAAHLLDRLHSAAETSGRAGNLVEIRMLQALAHDARGHRQQALERLGRALTQAPELDGYVRLFLDEGAPMTELLRGARRHGVAGEHARRLLMAGASGRAEPPGGGQGRATPSGESLTDRELQVLRLLDSELSGPQIARELFVSQNTLRTHTKHIFTKLDVTSRRGAVLRAREHGLL
jgi:LuxR family maltose regulon positive regulatory protein